MSTETEPVEECAGCGDVVPWSAFVDWDEDGGRCGDCVIDVAVPAVSASSGEERS